MNTMIIDLFVIIIIVINFGKNPSSGGSPPNDKNIILIIKHQVIFIFILLFIWFVIVIFLLLNIINIGIISIEYITKYMNTKFGKFIEIKAHIHPRCVIDEYAMITRNWDWLIPISPPVSAFVTASTVMYLFMKIIKDLIIIRGASFCHVDKITAFIHEIEFITEVYQKWQGNNPILMVSAISRIMYENI